MHLDVDRSRIAITSVQRSCTLGDILHCLAVRCDTINLLCRRGARLAHRAVLVYCNFYCQGFLLVAVRVKFQVQVLYCAMRRALLPTKLTCCRPLKPIVQIINVLQMNNLPASKVEFQLSRFSKLHNSLLHLGLWSIEEYDASDTSLRGNISQKD